MENRNACTHHCGTWGKMSSWDRVENMGLGKAPFARVAPGPTFDPSAKGLIVQQLETS